MASFFYILLAEVTCFVLYARSNMNRRPKIEQEHAESGQASLLQKVFEIAYKNQRCHGQK